MVRIKGDSSRWDDRDKLKHRSAEWDKKYLMEQVTEDEFIKRLAEGKANHGHRSKRQKLTILNSLVLHHMLGECKRLVALRFIF